MDKIIIDSDAIIGKMVPTDVHHEKTLPLFQRIDSGEIKAYITNLVIYEVATLFSRRYSQKQAVIFLDTIFSSHFEIIYIDELLSQKTVERFKSYSKKNISFVDCANLVAAEEKGINRIFSFDKVYKEKG